MVIAVRDEFREYKDVFSAVYIRLACCFVSCFHGHSVLEFLSYNRPTVVRCSSPCYVLDSCRYVNVVELTAKTLYKLLMDDVRLLCAAISSSRQKEDEILPLLAVVYKLYQLDNEWKEYISLGCGFWYLFCHRSGVVFVYEYFVNFERQSLRVSCRLKSD